jgi:hypothetical protein
MTMGRSLSIEEEQVFLAELFAVMVRHEERINAAKQVDREPTVPAMEPPSDSE